MRELNSKAEWCGGVAGGVASFRGRTLASPAGGTCFTDDDHVVFQLCDGAGCRLVRWNVRDNSHEDVLKLGITNTSADGGVWAAQATDGAVHDSLGRVFPEAGLSASSVGPDGDVAIKNKYQSYGPWTVYRKDGSKWFLQPGTNETQADGSDQGHDVNDLCLLGNGRASFTIHGEPQVVGVGVPLINPVTRPFWWLRLIETPLGWFALYQDASGRLLLQKAGGTLGYIVTHGGNSFEPDARAIGTDVWVRYSLSAGEPPQDIVVEPIDLAAPMVDLKPVAQPASQPQPAPVPAPAPAPVPEPPIMNVPDFSQLVKDLVSQHPDLAKANDLPAGGAIVHLFVETVRKTDTRFGYVSKVPGETQYEGDSQDSVAFNDNGNIVSVKILSGVGDPHPMDPVWTVGGALRTTDHWQYPGTATFPGLDQPPAPVPTPVPAPTPAPVVPDIPVTPSVDAAAILAAIQANTAKLEQMRQDFISFGKIVQQYAPALFGALAAGGGGLSGLLGSLTKKSS